MEQREETQTGLRHARVPLRVRVIGPAEQSVAGLRFTRRVDNVFAYCISRSLARYCAAWMGRLGLNDAPCYLSGQELPADVGGEMWLGCLQEDGLTGVNLRTFAEFTRRARERDYDLLMITVALRQLRKGIGQVCPLCATDHPLIHHIILHELVHALHPERAFDNPWTDRYVEKLLQYSNRAAVLRPGGTPCRLAAG